MTSWRHSVTRFGEIKICQLYLVNGTWSYGKMAFLVEGKIFSYKINAILCRNVNFDVTIMTSWHHYFWSTLWCFCRQIISRKSHQRNFLYLLPFKSYKQNSESWVKISPPLYRIRVKQSWMFDQQKAPAGLCQWKQAYRFCVEGRALKWFESYLCDRTQTYQVKDQQSRPRKVDCGVPQGSVLGPTKIHSI